MQTDHPLPSPSSAISAVMDEASVSTKGSVVVDEKELTELLGQMEEGMVRHRATSRRVFLRVATKNDLALTFLVFCIITFTLFVQPLIRSIYLKNANTRRPWKSSPSWWRPRLHTLAFSARQTLNPFKLPRDLPCIGNIETKYLKNAGFSR